MKEVEHIAVQSQRMMALKWMKKKPVSFSSTFHSDTMVAVSKKRDLHKPRGIQKYNLFMGDIDWKDEKLQAYETER